MTGMKIIYAIYRITKDEDGWQLNVPVDIYTRQRDAQADFENFYKGRVDCKGNEMFTLDTIVIHTERKE